VLYSYFEVEQVDAGRVPQILDWKASANCPRFYNIPVHRKSGVTIVATSGHLVVEIYKLIFAPGSARTPLELCSAPQTHIW